MCVEHFCQLYIVYNLRDPLQAKLIAYNVIDAFQFSAVFRII